MSKLEFGVLGTSRDEDDLLRSIGFEHNRLENAVEAGALMRTKITNQWLYAASPVALTRGLEFVEAEAVRRIRPWLIGAAPYIRGPIARASANPQLTVNAVELLLRELTQARRLRAFGMLTSSYEPYLGLFVPDDAEEVSGQVDALISALRERGYVRSGDLPAPKHPRERDGWRSLILRHGEFLGLGRLDQGMLKSWESPLAQ